MLGDIANWWVRGREKVCVNISFSTPVYSSVTIVPFNIDTSGLSRAIPNSNHLPSYSPIFSFTSNMIDSSLIAALRCVVSHVTKLIWV